MLIWIILFFLIVTISFILAFKSMNDYQEKPKNWALPYGLYLIKRPENLNVQLLDEICRKAVSEGVILSFERLLKGQRQALVVYAPVSLLAFFSQSLGLLEIEDFSQKARTIVREGNSPNLAVWEIGLKKGGSLKLSPKNFSEAVRLEEGDQFWLQVILQPPASFIGTQDQGKFRVVIRAVILAATQDKLEELKDIFSQIGSSQGLAQLPQAYTSEQLLKFYQERALPPGALTDLSARGRVLEASVTDLENLLSLN